ncbi:DUF6316 family protein [Spartinivicinus ruber]|uniref:DUF6316 family protein n=1 Tax=Spartinivicinus ruber TaxID=2683272 RepID=UPI0013D48763|nr:DUF6316 family protein [Spartinivicinus ruber]
MAFFRKDDLDKDQAYLAKRDDRCFKGKNGWFFKTREGKTLGPYDSKEQASEGVNQYLDFLLNSHPATLKLFFSL